MWLLFTPLYLTEVSSRKLLGLRLTNITDTSNSVNTRRIHRTTYRINCCKVSYYFFHDYVRCTRLHNMVNSEYSKRPVYSLLHAMITASDKRQFNADVDVNASINRDSNFDSETDWTSQHKNLLRVGRAQIDQIALTFCSPFVGEMMQWRLVALWPASAFAFCRSGQRRLAMCCLQSLYDERTQDLRKRVQQPPWVVFLEKGQMGKSQLVDL